MSCTEEDKISLLKTHVLSEQNNFLCTNITPKTHYPYLRSKYILSEEDEEVIEAQVTRKQKCHKMIDILITKGSRGFDELVMSLIQERTQLFIAETLNKAFEAKKRRLEELLRDAALPSSQVPVSAIVNGVDPQQNQASLRSSSGPPSLDSCPSTKLRTSVSDLGVDTDKLPKPVMVSKSSSKAANDRTDSLLLSGEIQFEYFREKSVEENEDKSRLRTISSSSSQSNA